MATADRMPKRLGRYEVRAKIAEGGMATIHLGRLAGAASSDVATPDSGDQADHGARRLAALKVIKDEYSLNRDFVNMFLDEAKIVSKLSHPNVVELYELGTEGNRLFIAMELMLGQSLWSVWEACRERHVRLRYDMIAWIGARVAEGLHHAHEARDASGAPQHVVHRDVNATNIFITYDGRVKVIDFGLAKAKNRISRTAAGIVKGKLAYMSPEQTVGKPLDRRTDLFALGTTLWELSVDRRLFKGKDDVDTLTAVHDAKVPDPRDLVDGYPTVLWEVLRRALRRDRDQRFPTAADFARELDAVAASDGRTLETTDVADVMRSLFEHERARQTAWVAEASAVGRSAALATLVPPRDSIPYGEMGLEQPEGAQLRAMYNAAAAPPSPTVRRASASEAPPRDLPATRAEGTARIERADRARAVAPRPVAALVEGRASGWSTLAALVGGVVTAVVVAALVAAVLFGR